MNKSQQENSIPSHPHPHPHRHHDKKSVDELLRLAQVSETALIPTELLKRKKNQILASQSFDSLPMSREGIKLHFHDDTFSLTSIDSSNDSLSIGSATSLYGVSLRDKIQRLEDNLKSGHFNLSTDFSTLQNLPPEYFTWDHKVKKKFKSRKKPPIDIIPCHQKPELIIALADDRIRKQLQAKENKQKTCQAINDRINEVIKFKEGRSERYARKLKLQQLQFSWIKAIYISQYFQSIKRVFEVEKAFNDAQNDEIVKTLSGEMTQYEKLLAERVIDFIKRIRTKLWIFVFRCRIFRKRRAVKILKTSLTETRDRKAMTGLIHKYLFGVRMVQKAMKSFLACKESRITAVSIIFEDIERQYIKKVIEEKRNEATHNTLKRLSQLEIDEKAKIELEKQNQKWLKANARMDQLFEQHKRNGTLVITGESVNIDSLMMDKERRIKLIEGLITEKRKEHVLGLQDLERKLNDSLKFSIADASSLIKGQTKAMTLDTQKLLLDNSLLRFNLFRTLKDEQMSFLIKKEHDALKTFEVKGEVLAVLRQIKKKHLIIKRTSSVNHSFIE